MIAVAGRSTLLERIRVTLAVRRLMMRKLWGTRSTARSVADGLSTPRSERLLRVAPNGPVARVTRGGGTALPGKNPARPLRGRKSAQNAFAKTYTGRCAAVKVVFCSEF